MLLGALLLLAPGLGAAQGPLGQASVRPDEEAPASRADELLRAAQVFLELDMPVAAVEPLREASSLDLSPSQEKAFDRSVGQVVGSFLGPLPELLTLLEAMPPSRFERLPRLRLPLVHLLLRAGRVSEAMDRIEALLLAEPKHQWGVFLYFLSRVKATPEAHLRRDPEIQNGALRRFVDRWAEHLELSGDLRGAQVLADFELWLDPEGERAESWAGRFLTLSGASSEGLSARGDVEARRGRPDRALPWYLWAAYTSSVRSPQEGAHWRRLASLYASFGWPEAAGDAASRVEGFEVTMSRPSRNSALAKRVEECRSWHDWLMAYRPESLVRQAGEGWEDLIEDFRQWNARCSFGEPDPFESTHGSCRPSHRLPRLAAEKLRLATLFRRKLDPSLFTANLRCLDQIALVLPERVDQLVDPDGISWPPSFWQTRSTLLLRRGKVSEALTACEEAVKVAQAEEERETAVDGCLDQLSRAPRHVLSRAGSKLKDVVLGWQDLHGGRAEVTPERALQVARVLLRWDPWDEATLRWVDRAIVLTTGSAEALDLRGELELERGRPDRALPWLSLAWDLSRPSPTEDRGLPLGLARAYVGVRWWAEPEQAAPEDIREAFAEEGLDLDELLPPPVPPSCHALLIKLTDQDVSRLIRVAGDGWQSRLSPLAEWRERCEAAPGAAS